MSPVSREVVNAGGTDYGSPFVGPIDHPVTISVDVTALSDDEIDANGVLKIGVPLTKAGALVAATEFVYGCVIESVKVAAGNAAADIAAASDAAQITVGTIGQVNQAILEDILGRALTADEIAGFDVAGSKLVLISPEA